MHQAHEEDLQVILKLAKSLPRPFGADIAVFPRGNQRLTIQAAHEMTPPAGRFYVSIVGLRARNPLPLDHLRIKTRINYRVQQQSDDAAKWLITQLLNDGCSNPDVIIVAAQQWLPHIYLELIEVMIAQRRPKTARDFALLPRFVPHSPSSLSRNASRPPTAESIGLGRDAGTYAPSREFRLYLAAHGLNV